MEKKKKYIDIYQELLSNRIIYLGSAIDSNCANRIISELLYLESENTEQDITMYINSPGGVITDGLAIYDTMNLIKPDVRTVCVGLAASMASFLLAAGTKGKRSALPNSEVMIHQPLGGVNGQASDILIESEHISWLREKMNRFYSEFSGQPYDRICIDTDRNKYMTANEAKEYGLIDSVITKMGSDADGR